MRSKARLIKAVRKVERMTAPSQNTPRRWPRAISEGVSLYKAALEDYPDPVEWSHAANVTLQRNIWGFKLASEELEFAEDGSEERYTYAGDYADEYTYALNLSGNFFVPENTLLTLESANGNLVFRYENKIIRGIIYSELTETGPVQVYVAEGEFRTKQIWCYFPMGSFDTYPMGSIVIGLPKPLHKAVHTGLQ